MQASSLCRSDVPWFDTSCLGSYLYAGFDKPGVIPAVNGVLTPPTRYEVKIRPSGITYGSGDYYHYTGPCNWKRSYGALKRSIYETVMVSTSMDIKWEGIYYSSSGEPLTQYRAIYYSNGLFAYTISYLRSANAKGGGGRVRWVKFKEFDSQNRMILERFSSPMRYDLTDDTWEAILSPYLNAVGTESRGGYETTLRQEATRTVADPPGQHVFEWYQETQVLERPFQLLAARAYLDQANSMPQVTVNTAQNVLESAGLVSALITRNFGSLKRLQNPKDAWLAYRYSFNTTKSDIGEYLDLTRRLMSLATSSCVTSHGYATQDDVTCHCTCTYDPAQALPNTTREFLKKYGLELSLVNVWDMIPYSFVVDWFLHIGDYLQDLQDRQNMLDLTPTSIWYSFQRTEPDGASWYTRMHGVPYYNAPYVGRAPASTKTCLMRVGDSISLFT